MRRSQQERSVSTIARLRRATVALIAERGYASVTTIEIAQRAGVSRGALLHHFPLKIDLIVDAAEEIWRDAAIHVRRLSEELSRSADYADAFVDGMWDHVFREEVVKMSIDLTSAAQADADLRARLDQPLRQLFDAYGEIADQVFAGSGMSHDQRLTLVSVATCAIRGLRVQNIMAPSPGMTEAVLRELKAYLRASLARGAPVRPVVAALQGSAQG
jgi:AcrR family transcriptional regulator